MNIRSLHFSSKPSYKLIRNGAAGLDTAELLAILLGNGNKQESVLELSHRLVKDYNLHGLDGLSYRQLHKICDNPVHSLRILSFLELSKRYNKLINGGYKERITSAEDVFKRFRDRLGQEKQEHFIVLYLDSKHQVLKEETISLGTLDASLVHPREVFKRAIQESAYGIILVHNHPSGDPSPSEGDKDVTERLRDAAKLLKFKLLDHVVMGKEKYYSFKEDGKLN